MTEPSHDVPEEVLDEPSVFRSDDEDDDDGPSGVREPRTGTGPHAPRAASAEASLDQSSTTG